MNLTPERLAELKTMAGHAKSHFCIELAEAFVRSVPDLIADLEEAKEQLASPYMDGYEAAKEEYRPQIIALEEQLAATRKKLADTQEALLAERNRREHLLEMANGIGCDSLTDVFKMVSSLRKQLAEAQALIEPYRKDAERFKELLSRLGDDSGLTIVKIEGWSDEYPGYAWFADLSQEQVIAELDAAIAAKGESE